ncbi:MAG: type II secretion system protein [Candidatus Rokubacteria bacterium]|nr:type II secretion system protein [Candidatus Rokubacteria bacterium]
MRRLVENQRGMTLAEILVAIAIIGVGLAALAAAIPLSGYGIQEGSQLSTATFLATERLEQAKNASWTETPAVDNLGVSSGDAAPQSGGTTTFPDETAVAAPYTAYSRKVRITDCGLGGGCAGITDANLRQATVTVTYRPLTGVGQSPATKSATVTMLIARR